MFLLRHIFIFYVFALYNIAPLVLGTDEAEYYGWFLEFMAVLILFVIGYSLGLRLARRKRGLDTSIRAISEHKVGLLKLGLLALLLVNALVLAQTIMSFGVTEFYAGAQLAAAFETYGKFNPTGAVVQVLTFLLGAMTTALLYVLVEYVVNQQGLTQLDSVASLRRQSAYKRLALRLSFTWQVFFPLIQFGRSALVFGTLTYLAIRSKLAKKLFTLSTIFLGTLALGFFVYVGLSRAERIGTTSNVESLFISELTPWLAYHDIKTNIEQLGYQHGYTLFMPFLFRVIPRALFPEKPWNTSGYFMTTLYPDQFRAGFALPPTYMGDLYLNYGLLGVLGGIFLLGIFSGYIDGIVIYRQFRHFGLFLIVLTNYFSLLRNNIPDSVFGILIIAVIYFVAKRWVAIPERQRIARLESG